MILADTSVWIDALTAKMSEPAHRLSIAVAQQNVVVGDLVATEVLQGIRAQREFTRVSNLFGQLKMVTLCGPQLAPIAAANYRKLRQKGITVRSTIDVIIATWCIENEVALLHNDRDYAPLEAHLGLIAA